MPQPGTYILHGNVSWQHQPVALGVVQFVRVVYSQLEVAQVVLTLAKAGGLQVAMAAQHVPIVVVSVGGQARAQTVDQPVAQASGQPMAQPVAEPVPQPAGQPLMPPTEVRAQAPMPMEIGGQNAVLPLAPQLVVGQPLPFTIPSRVGRVCTCMPGQTSSSSSQWHHPGNRCHSQGGHRPERNQ